MIPLALEALTTPKPSSQQVLIRLIVEWAMRRFPGQQTGDRVKVTYLLFALARLGAIKGMDMPTISPKAWEQLVNTCVDAWTLSISEAKR